MGNYLYLDGGIGTGIYLQGGYTYNQIVITCRLLNLQTRTANILFLDGGMTLYYNVSGNFWSSTTTTLFSVDNASQTLVNGVKSVIPDGMKTNLSFTLSSGTTSGYCYILDNNGWTAIGVEAEVYNIAIYNAGVLTANYDFTAQSSGTSVPDSTGQHTGITLTLHGNYQWKTEPTVATPPVYDSRNLSIGVDEWGRSVLGTVGNRSEVAITRNVGSATINAVSSMTANATQINSSTSYHYEINQGITRNQYLRLDTAITYTDVEITLSWHDLNDWEDFWDDYGGSSPEVYYLPNSGTLYQNGWSNVYIDGVASNDVYPPVDSKFTLKLSLASARTSGTDTSATFGSDGGSGKWTQGKFYNIKFYNAGTLVAHFDLTQGVFTDQTGNGNTLTPVGGAFVQDTIGTTQTASTTIAGVGTITASGTIVQSANCSMNGVGGLSTTGNAGYVFVNDTFTRADSTSLGNAETGQTWTYDGSAGFGVSANQAYPLGTYSTALATIPSNTDLTVSVAIATLADGRIYIKYIDYNNHLRIQISGTVMYLYSQTTSNPDVLVGSTSGIVSGDQIKTVCQGTTATVYVNGVQKIQGAYDSSINYGTNAGFYNGATTNNRFDDFKVESVPVTTLIQSISSTTTGTATITASGTIVNNSAITSSMNATGTLSITGSTLSRNTALTFSQYRTSGGSGSGVTLIQSGGSSNSQGASSLTANIAGAILSGSTSPKIVGSMTSTGAIVTPISAIIRGVGTLTANSTLIQSSATTMQGVATTTSTGILSYPLSASLQSIGNVTANGIIPSQITVSVTGTGVLSANGTQTQVASVSANGVGAITANAIAIDNTTVTTSSVATLNANISMVGIVSASMAGATTATISGFIVTPLGSNVNIIGMLTATGQVTGGGISANMQGASTLGISSVTEKSGVSAQVTASTNVTASQVNGTSSSISSTGNTTANVTKIVNPTASIQGIGSLTGVQQWIQSISTNIQGVGSSTADGKGIYKPTSNVPSVSVIDSSATKVTYGNISYQGMTILTADGVAYDPQKLIIGKVYLGGSRELNLNLQGSREIDVHLKGGI